jgi:hypothetical protein
MVNHLVDPDGNVIVVGSKVIAIDSANIFDSVIVIGTVDHITCNALETIEFRIVMDNCSYLFFGYEIFYRWSIEKEIQLRLEL